MIECPIEEDVPIPLFAGVPYGDLRERAAAACRAASMLLEEGYEDSPFDEDAKQKANQVLANTAKGDAQAANRALASVNSAAGYIYVDQILSQYDMEVVHEAKRLRHYVTNKLITETENPDPRIRMKALELLGKHSDVGLFTERSEVTINNRSTVELENTLKEKLRKLMGSDDVEDAVLTKPPIQVPESPDVDEILGGE